VALGWTLENLKVFMCSDSDIRQSVGSAGGWFGTVFRKKKLVSEGRPRQKRALVPGGLRCYHAWPGTSAAWHRLESSCALLAGAPLISDEDGGLYTNPGGMLMNNAPVLAV